MIELRDTGPSGYSVSGLATTWSGGPTHQTYYVSDLERGVYLERVQRGAFVNATSGREDVELRRDHATAPAYASTSRGTMRLVDQEDGLFLSAALPKGNATVEAAVRDIKAGVLKGLSVGMKIDGDHWSTAPDGRTQLRTLTSGRLAEVSMVRMPSNRDTTLEVRGEGEALEYRAVPLTYRATATTENVPIPDLGGIRPPNLRPGDATTRCSTCEWFDSNSASERSCMQYCYAVRPSWLCDSWEAINDTEPDGDADDARQGRSRRTPLIANDESLLEQLVTRRIR